MKNTLKPNALYWASFDRFELRLPGACVADCSHSGRCNEDVAHWQTRVDRPTQCTPEALAAELKEYGAWDATELADDAANWQRILWIAAGNISDDEKPDCSTPVGKIELLKT